MDLLGEETSGIIVPAYDQQPIHINEDQVITGVQHPMQFEAAKEAHVNLTYVSYGDPLLYAKIWPHLFPYATGCWSRVNRDFMQRANYVKFRLMQLNDHFRRDQGFSFFNLDLKIKDQIRSMNMRRVNAKDQNVPLTVHEVSGEEDTVGR